MKMSDEREETTDWSKISNVSSRPQVKQEEKNDPVVSSRPQVKQEEKNGPVDGHSHRVIVKFSSSDKNKYPFHCDRPRTVLEVLKSHTEWRKNIKCPDDRIIIQMGKGDMENIISTHFPCTCLKNEETLTLHCENEEVEQKPEDVQDTMIHPVEQYSVFFIDTVGGVNSRTKRLFRNQETVKKFKFLCVYGKNKDSVEEALRRDGRFSDYPESFKLSDNQDRTMVTVSTDTIQTLSNKKFKIILPQNKVKDKDKDGKKQEDEANKSGFDHETVIEKVAEMRNRSVEPTTTKTGEGRSSLSQEKLMEIYESLCKQFPHLKEVMESRADGNTLKVGKENFGKVQQSFSQVFRQQKLHQLGQSVCKVTVGDVCTGTGFVLFGNYIITNAHLFNNCIDGRELHHGIEVRAMFNYVIPDQNNDYYYFRAKKMFVDLDCELDYAVVELDPQGRKKKGRYMNVPKGLLDKFGPLPETGEACIIGHPNGEVQRNDPTWIIEKEKREDAVRDHIEPYTKSHFQMQILIDHLNEQGLQNLLQSNTQSTYDTFLFHGASGSPVIDGHGRVFGLHTSGLWIEKPTDGQIDRVIESAQSLLTIFDKFVTNLKNRTDPESQRVLEEVKAAANKNTELIRILNFEEMITE